MNEITNQTDLSSGARDVANGLAGRNRVRELAAFLGLDAESVAAGLAEAVKRDLLRSGGTYRLDTTA